MRSLHSFSPRRSRNRLIKPFVFVRRRFSERSFFGLIFRAEKTPHGYTLYNYFMSLSTILRLSRRNVENKCGGAAGHNKASPWEKALKCRVERTRRRAAMGKSAMTGSSCGQVGDGRKLLQASRRCPYLLFVEQVGADALVRPPSKRNALSLRHLERSREISRERIR